MRDPEADDVVLKLLHTADWHLGLRFPGFDEEDEPKLTRARLQVVERILDLADRHAVDAVLCAGDLFDGPSPEKFWWEGLAAALARVRATRPIFLLPGNHDPLTPESVWAPAHPFRQKLPSFVHVVDRDDFEWKLKDDAVLLALPCRSRAGQRDLALALPARERDDRRVRIGMVHGTTFDLEGYEQDFPIHRDAAVLRGLDYLAIGDTHGFREVQAAAPVPTIYPGAPEPTKFGETGAGNVALVLVRPHGRRASVRPEPVGYWRWREETVNDLASLRRLRDAEDLTRSVVRVVLDLAVTPRERDEVERILGELRGTEAAQGRAGILQVDRTRLRASLDAGADELPPDAPEALKAAVARLKALAQGPEREVAHRALGQLWRLVQEGA